MPARKPTKTPQVTPENGEDISWQAQKSAMTRDRILDAAINCFITLGYTNVTTAKVASTAGVSRGAMLHHFPSKTELIQAAVEYLHNKLLEDYTARVNKIPKTRKGKSRRRAGLDAVNSGEVHLRIHTSQIAAQQDIAAARGDRGDIDTRPCRQAIKRRDNSAGGRLRGMVDTKNPLGRTAFQTQ